MAIYDILFAKKEVGAIYSNDNTTVIRLDAVISDDHSYVNNATKFPVEKGFSISDHVIQEPEQLTLKGVITNAPILLPGQKGFITSKSKLMVQNAFNDMLKMMGYTMSYDRNSDTYDIKYDVQLVAVVTGLKIYENMLITSFKIPRDQRTGDALKFTATFQKINVTTNQTYETSKKIKAKPKSNTEKKAAPKVKKGKLGDRIVKVGERISVMAKGLGL